MWFSRYRELNDPFDGIIPWTFDGDEAGRAFWRRHAEREGHAGANLDARVEDLVARGRTAAGSQSLIEQASIGFVDYGVCCLSEVDNDLLMWAYYGDGLRGACLVFDTEALFREYAVERGLLLPVEYLESYPRVNYYTSTDFEKLHAVLATKGSRWSHEREWRLVMPYEHGSISFRGRTLTGIIFGSRADGDERARIEALVRQQMPETKIGEAHPASGRFDIEVRWA